ncbi:hypothetical protein HZB08_00240, partial [Candidatus Saganbacteria bacterium]|nr:hypothetical protein [Candidatus Saganbacteria bacterium]
NHLPVILSQKAAITSVSVASAETSDTASPFYRVIYVPSGKVDALKTLANGKRAMRAGYLNDDKYIDVSDYAVWKSAVTAVGTVEPGNPNSVRSDLNGDGMIDITDYSLWKGTVQDFTPGGVPQTGDQVYVP